MFSTKQKPFFGYLLFVAAAVAVFFSCSSMDMGSQSAKTTATGAASGGYSENANAQLDRCDATLGTVAILENENSDWFKIVTNDLRLGPTAPVLRLLAQQSNCFVVVERGRAMDSMMRERAIQDSGEMRKGSNFGQGQMVAADYTLTPTITFSNKDAGGLTSAISALFGSKGSVATSVGGSVSVKEASVLLTLIENRSGVQVSAAEGSSRNMDFGATAGIFGSKAGGSLGGYSNTAEGKVITAALTDAYINLVRATRNYQQQKVKGGLGTGGNLKIQQ